MRDPLCHSHPDRHTDTDTDLWCEVCGAACATTVSYLVEEAGTVVDVMPAGVHRLTWGTR